MIAVNYTTLRENMKSCMDKVTDDYETLIEEAYNNLMENVYVVGNRANYDWLMESKAQLEQGDFSSHELIEVPENE